MTIAGLIIGAVWTYSILIAYRLGFEKGWHKGHDDTKNATYEVLDNVRRKAYEKTKERS